MGKRIILLVVVFFIKPNVGYTQHIFDEHPLLLAPVDKDPYRAVGVLLRTNIRPFVTACTATPIAPTIVLTSAHCLYRLQTSSWVPQLYFLPTLSIRKGVPIEAAKYIIPKEYVATDRDGKRDFFKGESFDFGVVILKRALDDHISSVFSVVFKHIPPAISHRTEWPETRSVRRIPARDDLPTESSDLRMLAGYTSKDYKPNPRQLHVSFCPIAPFAQKDDDGLNRFFYAYRCSAVLGTCGSPLFYREGDKYKIQGISRGHFGDHANHGVYINYENYERIVKWTDPKRGADSIEDMSTTF